MEPEGLFKQCLSSHRRQSDMKKEIDHKKLFIQIFNTAVAVSLMVILAFAVVLVTLINPNWVKPKQVATVSKTQNLEIDMAGFVEGDGRELVAMNCTRCHSAKLVTQNRATRDGWKSMIVWMQETQNLWPLGTNEPIILDYLAKNYGPQKKGRRPNLANIEWYELEN